VSVALQHVQELQACDPLQPVLRDDQVYPTRLENVQCLSDVPCRNHFMSGIAKDVTVVPYSLCVIVDKQEARHFDREKFGGIEWWTRATVAVTTLTCMGNNFPFPQPAGPYVRQFAPQLGTSFHIEHSLLWITAEMHTANSCISTTAERRHIA